MNKYLEKIAATRKPVNKVELEPGVYYNLDKHELTPTPAHMKEFMDRKDHHNRLFTGSVGALYGAGFGVAAGNSIGNKVVYKGNIPSRYQGLSKAPLNPIVKRFRIGGAGLGALGLGALTYLVGGLDPTQKKPLKDAYLDKLERRYENKIDELEGWDD